MRDALHMCVWVASGGALHWGWLPKAATAMALFDRAQGCLKTQREECKTMESAEIGVKL